MHLHKPKNKKHFKWGEEMNRYLSKEDQQMAVGLLSSFTLYKAGFWFFPFIYISETHRGGTNSR